MAQLFEVTVPTINEHLRNIFSGEELDHNSTIRKFRIVRSEGNRKVERNIDFYNLDAIISVGYRVNSVRATQFRQWATRVLRDFAIKGTCLISSVWRMVRFSARIILNDCSRKPRYSSQRTSLLPEGYRHLCHQP